MWTIANQGVESKAFACEVTRAEHALQVFLSAFVSEPVIRLIKSVITISDQ
jgi:hypothetical protein